ncbi:centromere protein O-like [Corticium candelabrum]|uniref:centromere protein O-like n=1 Tax=Corticium candelabrum TaxID=121492 RepID=UPI002E26B6FA|nr:centromere protein O-like [Corticium candelabrum]
MESLTKTQDRDAKRSKTESETELPQDNEEIRTLKEQYESLISKKKSLQRELENVMPQRLASSLMQEVTGGKLPDYTTSALQREVLVRAVKTAEKRKHEDILWAYRLAGLSAKVEGTTAMLTIETSRSGQYFEPFYLELKFADKIHIGHHTVPYFIPLKSIASSHLNSNAKLFVSTVHRHLNAYVSRRQQAYDTQQQHKDWISGRVDASYAVDYVHFTLKPIGALEEPLEVRLLYTDLKSSLPEVVKITPKDAQTVHAGVKRWCRQQKVTFKEQQLPEAVTILILSLTGTN